VAPADGFAFWSEGRAIRSAYSASETRKLTIETHCQSTHDIYVGTRLDGNCGIISAALDGGTPITLDCYGAGVQVVAAPSIHPDTGERYLSVEGFLPTE
jgi:hypothetical protein